MLAPTLETIERRFDPDHLLALSARDALADLLQEADRLEEAGIQAKLETLYAKRDG